MNLVLVGRGKPMYEALNANLFGKAHSVFSLALKRGEIERAQLCERCGFEGLPHDRILGHHNDYAKPLEVEWLCRRCHVVAHYSIRDEDRDVVLALRAAGINRWRGAVEVEAQ